MYESFFNFHTPPFASTPDPAFFFESEQHGEAFAAVEFALRTRQGVTIITGDLGAGKTTVARTITQRLDGAATIVPVLFGVTGREEMIRHMLRRLGTHTDRAADHSELLETLLAVLAQRPREAGPLVLLVDEAQTLSDEVLDELRLLTTLDQRGMQDLCVVLVGQHELLDRLANPRLAALRHRVATIRQLAGFDHRTTLHYIQHRIRTASRNPDALGVHLKADAIHEIHRYSGGVPRLINHVCDHALLLAYVRQQHGLTGVVVRAVVHEMLPQVSKRLHGDAPLARIDPGHHNTLARSA